MPGWRQDFARPEQLPPLDNGWHTWILTGGRQSGKTRAGAEFLVEQAFLGRIKHPVVLVRDVESIKHVMHELHKATINHHPSFDVTFQSFNRRAIWNNGCIAYFFTYDTVRELLYVITDHIWADEFNTWDYPIVSVLDGISGEAFLHEGGRRLIVTGTPSYGTDHTSVADAVFKVMIHDDPIGVRRSRTSSLDNLANLSRKATFPPASLVPKGGGGRDGYWRWE